MNKLPFIILFSLFTHVCFAGTVYLIVNKKNNEKITKEFVKKVYLGRVTVWSNGNPIKPFVNKSDKSSFNKFLSGVLDMSPQKYISYWRVKLFSGNGIPPRNIAGELNVVLSKVENSNEIIFYSFNKIESSKVKSIPIEIK